MAKEFKYEVKKTVGVISENGKAKMEIRLISWNEATPKYDIRDWWHDKDGNEKMGKGITFTEEELKSLYEILKKKYGD